ncbi:beta-phosphoglucomutase [Proteiniclasticum sp. C24MP]|uniref:beta-phosphoglucomutase n=1 Tax=Proteiniclasticum sp. C24MP TaxID=3374101 RepID=UPI0037546616
MGIKAVVFDLDGVLVNTDRFHYLAWKRILQELGKDFSVEDNEQIKGVARSKSLEILLQMKNITMSEVEKMRILRKKNNLYLEYITEIDEEYLLNGVEEFLELLKFNGLRTAIASTSDNTSLVLEMTGLKKYFDVVIDGHKVKAPKPNPEVYLVCAMELRIEPDECAVFEDSRAGVLSAKRAGMKVIAVSDRIIGEADKCIASLKNLDMSILDFQ